MGNKPTYQELERRVDELLKEKDEKFTQLIRNSFDIIVLLDSDGMQRYVSESCEKILGYKPEELTHIPVIEKMIHPEDREKAIKGLKDIIEKNEHGGVQYRHRHKNGGWVYLESFGTNQINNPAIRAVVLNVRDVSERKRAEQALQESEARLKELNATKDRFFSIIGHDLRSPLSIINGLSGLLLEQIHNQDYKELEKNARVIQKSSQRITDLLTNLLIWSQSQTGKIKFNPQYFEFTSLVDEVSDLLSSWASQKSIRISKSLPKDLPITADFDMVSTILRNLISNGIKFTKTDGEIKILAEKKSHQIIVSVKDNGIGIRQKDIDKLFQIENAYSNTGTQKENGTGLGLLLCKEFIEMHGGKIWVESTVGKGSTFSFMLPQELPQGNPQSGMIS